MCNVLCMPLHALPSALPSQPLAQVYERLPEPPAPDDLSVWGNFEQASERLYMIGLNGRGQGVLRGLGVMDRIDTASSIVVGRCVGNLPLGHWAIQRLHHKPSSCKTG